MKGRGRRGLGEVGARLRLSEGIASRGAQPLSGGPLLFAHLHHCMWLEGMGFSRHTCTPFGFSTLVVYQNHPRKR